MWLRDDTAIANIYNNIIWGNTADGPGNDGDDLYVDSDGNGKNGNGTGSPVNLYNNDLGVNSNFTTGQSEDLYIRDIDNYHQANNIKLDPLFVNAPAGDFHLQGTSPCINKGLDTAPGIPSTDFEGDPRKIGSHVDIGADEYR